MKHLIFCFALLSGAGEAGMIKYIKDDSEGYLAYTRESVRYDVDYVEASQNTTFSKRSISELFGDVNHFSNDYLDRYYACDFAVPEDYQLWLQRRKTQADASMLDSHQGYALKNEYVVLANSYHKNVMVLRESKIINSCIGGTQDYAFSRDGRYLTILTRSLTGIDVLDGKGASPILLFDWSEDFIVKLYDLDKPFNPSYQLRIATDDVKDIAVNEDGFVFVLTENQKTNWVNPLNWLVALSGHSNYVSDIFLLSISNHGAIEDKEKIFADEKSIFVKFME